MSAPQRIDETAVDPDAPLPKLEATPPVRDVAAFFAVLGKSRLVSREVQEALRDEFRQETEAKPSDLAARLVQQGHITQWQSEQLLAGKSEFFLGRYKFLDRLGVGGMGAVFKAEHEMMGRVVALKMIRRKLTEHERTRKRFLREIKAVAALEHPNIVTAYDADHVGNTYFLVMEFVDGKDLGWWVEQRGPFSFKWACEFCRQAATGLQHAHKRGLVHRDIKPSNLLAIREPKPNPPTIKILDFGLALLDTDDMFVEPSLLEGGVGGESAVTSVVGTFGFLAPEQFRQPPQIDIRSDIFSLGCTLFYLLTGNLPFLAKSEKEYLAHLLKGEPHSARQFTPEVPAGLETVLRKMLARNPDDRYQTPQEVADALWPFCSSTMQDFAAARLPVPLPASVAKKLPAAKKPQAIVDTALNEFSKELTNKPTDITGLDIEELLSAKELGPSAPLPASDPFGHPPEDSFFYSHKAAILTAIIASAVLILAAIVYVILT